LETDLLFDRVLRLCDGDRDEEREREMEPERERAIFSYFDCS
jgi:hypothetical protein